MNSPIKRQQERELELQARFCKLHSLSPEELSLLRLIAFGASPRPFAETIESLPTCAVRPRIPILASREGTERAIMQLMSHGWLKVLTPADCHDIWNPLATTLCVGPLCNYPAPLNVEISTKTATLLSALAKEEYFELRSIRPDVPMAETPKHCYLRPELQIVDYLFPTRNLADAFLRLGPDSQSYAYHFADWRLNPPQRIGPWRRRWWERFDDGYCVRTELSAPEVWTFESRALAESKLTERLRAIDARGRVAEQGVTNSQLLSILTRKRITQELWIVLCIVASKDGSWTRLSAKRLAAESRWHAYGTITELQAEHAVALGIANGWLWQVDTDVNEKIKLLIEEDCALPPLIEWSDHTAESPGIDVTPAGAELFREIDCELYGPYHEYALSRLRGDGDSSAWTNSVHGRAEVYSRYVLYSNLPLDETDVAVNLGNWALDECSIGDPCEFGAWCDRWWEVHPAGSRLHIETGSR